MIEGNDGGACVSFNGGATWSTIYNQPTAQFYHVTTDDQFPYRVYGSQQDNTAISVPSATTDGAIHERDLVSRRAAARAATSRSSRTTRGTSSPRGPAGRRAYNDIMTRYDHRTGQIRNITVWPELYGWGAARRA